ncbi:uncharacterized protein [Rutidosis leptorrhynchoides]|uniref:uncharacterized protein n=1 Tax=Rutidosis leptorrhynchoides TaxID=125765 RepID=UPI003A9A0703
MGRLNNYPAMILIDSGATHNFISRKLVDALGLSITTIPRLNIRLGDGNHIGIFDQCRNIKLQFGKFTCCVDALVYEIGPLDIILGIAWLEKLGDIICNWETHLIQFWDKGEKVKLQGINSPLFSLQSWLSGQLDLMTH